HPVSDDRRLLIFSILPRVRGGAPAASLAGPVSIGGLPAERFRVAHTPEQYSIRRKRNRIGKKGLFSGAERCAFSRWRLAAPLRSIRRSIDVAGLAGHRIANRFLFRT